MEKPRFNPNSRNQAAIKHTKLIESVEEQLTLINEIKIIVVSIQNYEQAAYYRSMEKDFEDLLEHLKNNITIRLWNT